MNLWIAGEIASFVDFDNVAATCEELNNPASIMESILDSVAGTQKDGEGTSSLDNSYTSILSFSEAVAQMDRLRKYANKLEPGSEVLQNLTSAKRRLVKYSSESD